MATEIVVTPSVLNTTEGVTQANIIISDTSDWVIMPVCLDGKVCSSFDGCSVPMYEYLFTSLGMLLPFSDYEVAMMNHLKLAPSKLHPGAWALKLVFQLCVGYKSWKSSLGIFFELFSVAFTFLRT